MKRIFAIALIFLFLVTGTVKAQQQKTLLVLNGTAESLHSVNLSYGTSVHTVDNAFGQVPNDIVINNGKGYIVNSQSHNIQQISLTDFSVEHTISLPTVNSAGANPMKMVFVGKNKAYVISFVHGKVYIIDTEKNEVSGSVTVGSTPMGILRMDRTVYVANSAYNPATYSYDQGSVSIIDADKDSVICTLETPVNPQALAAGPDNKVYIACTGDYSSAWGKIVVIDLYGSPTWTPAIVDTVEVGGSPTGIAMTSTGKAFLAAGGEWQSGSNGYVIVYDSQKKTVTHSGVDSTWLLTGNGVMNVICDKETDDIYISCFSDDKVQKIDPATVTITAEYPVGDGPGAMAIWSAYGATDPYADAVVSFTQGSNYSGFGYEYFPENVLGPPDSRKSLSETNPSNDPKEILSLGHGGEIVLEFTNNTVINGPGKDFTVFENPFISYGSYFVEAGIVSVSQDGTNWYAFPFDTAGMDLTDPSTFSGLAGVHPTLPGNPQNPDESGGDSFDLSDIKEAELSWIKYVKITDLGDIKQEGPYNGDFDLDAVAAIYSSGGQALGNGSSGTHTFSQDDTDAMFCFENNMALHLGFTHGASNGKMVTVQYHGTQRPSDVPAGQQLQTCLAYMEITSNMMSIQAQLEISYNHTMLSNLGLHAEDLVISHYNTTQGRWDTLSSTVDTVAKIVSTTTTHFSIFALASKTDPLLTGIDDGNGSVPLQYKLSQNYPNPFNPSTRIDYQLPRNELVKITVYNSLGQQVKVLINKRQPAGKYHLAWNGRNAAGQRVSSGVYLYRFESESFFETRKMLLLK